MIAAMIKSASAEDESRWAGIRDNRRTGWIGIGIGVGRVGVDAPCLRNDNVVEGVVLVAEAC